MFKKLDYEDVNYLIIFTTVLIFEIIAIIYLIIARKRVKESNRRKSVLLSDMKHTINRIGTRKGGKRGSLGFPRSRKSAILTL